MSFPNGYYTDEQIVVLSLALDLACKELHIGAPDDQVRERIALVIMAIAHSQPCDAESLAARAIELFEDGRLNAS